MNFNWDMQRIRSSSSIKSTDEINESRLRRSCTMSEVDGGIVKIYKLSLTFTFLVLLFKALRKVTPPYGVIDPVQYLYRNQDSVPPDFHRVSPDGDQVFVVTLDVGVCECIAHDGTKMVTLRS